MDKKEKIIKYNNLLVKSVAHAKLGTTTENQLISWASWSRLNYLKLVIYFQDLCGEYFVNTGKEHVCDDKILIHLENARYISSGPEMPFDFEKFEKCGMINVGECV